MHLVKEMKSGKVTTKCGTVTDTRDATIWTSEADCDKCLGKRVIRRRPRPIV
jgi:hypothetical protein